jgi:hypothetical protein
LDDDRWHRIVDDFQDASVFQTIPFCIVKSQSAGLEHLVLRKGADPIAAAQVRIFRVPFTGASIAYVLWGPLCHRRNSPPDWTAFGHALRVLREEYVVKRHISVRIATLFTPEAGTAGWPVFEREGFARATTRTPSRTIIIDLTRPLDELRKGLDKKWRNCLNSAEKNGLEMRQGSDDSSFELFLQVYREMLARKRLAEPGDIRSFRAMQTMLPDRFKMKVFVALDGGEPSAGAICSGIGRRGLFLFGATADSGMRNKASYLVQWEVLRWLKELECVEYDLHGSDAVSNPGVYAFKMGFCGKNGREVEAAPYFEASGGTRGRMMLTMADRVNHECKRLKTVYARYRGFQG